MLESAYEIKFHVSRSEKEPHRILIVFRECAKSTVYYDEIKIVYKDGEMSLAFEKIAGEKSKVQFIRNSDQFVDGHILVAYDSAELDEFVKKVNPNDAYAVIFGAVVEGELVITPGIRKEASRSAIVFCGIIQLGDHKSKKAPVNPSVPLGHLHFVIKPLLRRVLKKL